MFKDPLPNKRKECHCTMSGTFSMSLGPNDNIKIAFILSNRSNKYIQILGSNGVPEECKKQIIWALNIGRFQNQGWYGYPEMEADWGVKIENATFNDFQRIFKCRNKKKEKCNEKGLEFPKTCSKSPCNMCPSGK